MTLEEIKSVTEYSLPFELISKECVQLKIIDCLFSNYEVPLSVADIADEINVSPEEIEPHLEKFLIQKLIKQEKDNEEILFVANFSSRKTMGLFSYYRAVLDENLEKLAYNKINLK